MKYLMAVVGNETAPQMEYLLQAKGRVELETSSTLLDYDSRCGITARNA